MGWGWVGGWGGKGKGKGGKGVGGGWRHPHNSARAKGHPGLPACLPAHPPSPPACSALGKFKVTWNADAWMVRERMCEPGAGDDWRCR